MKKLLLPFLSLVLGLILSAWLLLLVSQVVLGSAPDSPVVTGITPNNAPNHLDASVHISGSGFASVLSGTQVITSPAVYLNAVHVPGFKMLSTTELSGTVPWGLEPGVYDLTVENPDGVQFTLPDAYTVTQGIGVFTSYGPFGGSINSIAVSPVTSTTVFAEVYGAGLYRTTNGGESWDLAVADTGARGLVIVASAPNYVYFWGTTGLWGSSDSGATFTRRVTSGVSAFVIHPTQPAVRWRVSGGVVWYTTNFGSSWTWRSEGIPDEAAIRNLLVDPSNPDTLYLVDDYTGVYKTTDAGLTWKPFNNNLPPIMASHRLRMDPFDSQHLILTQITQERFIYQTWDGGANWQPVSFPDALGEPGHRAVEFSTTISGTIYIGCNADNSTYILCVSHDAGSTWAGLTLRDGKFESVRSIGIFPPDGKLAYLGSSSSGVHRCIGDCTNREIATEGISAITIFDIAPEPMHPERVYVAAVDMGAYYSSNAGASWRMVDNLPYPWAEQVAFHPTDTQRILIDTGTNVFRTLDGGTTWDIMNTDWPPEELLAEIMELSYSKPNIVFAGGEDFVAAQAGRSVGVLYKSTDFGENWMEINFTQPISQVMDIAIDPTNEQIMYIATGSEWDINNIPGPGLGILRSMDGGATWQPLSSGPLGHFWISSIAIDPVDPKIIYAVAYDRQPDGTQVYKSMDRGQTWTAPGLLPVRLNALSQHIPLAIDPLDHQVLYVGGKQGLMISLNGGTTWNRVNGPMGSAPVYELGVGATADRSVLYVGTPGGFTGSAYARAGDGLFIPGSEYLYGGVYQLTTSYRQSHRSFIPVVKK